jgi:hypothetical protein
MLHFRYGDNQQRVNLVENSETPIFEGETFMQEIFCESCGMPMGETNEMYGTESNGSKSVDFCKHCYVNGAFTNPNLTLQEQIESVAVVMVRDFGFSPEDAREQCNQGIPNLKRWKTA